MAITKQRYYICWCKHNNNGNNTKRNWIIFLNIINLKRKITQHYLDWSATLALFKEIQALGWLFISIFDTSTLHLSFVHVSNPISDSIHISPLITTIKRNKIVSLIFNVRLNIFTNSSFSIFTPASLHLCCNIYSF